MYRGIPGFVRLAAALLGVWLTLRFALPIALPFLLGMALALLAEPLVCTLQKQLRLHRSLAAGVGVSLTFCAVAILIVLLCAFLLRELGLLAGILPDMEQTARSGIALVERQLLNLTAHTPQGIRPILTRNIRGAFSDGAALINRVTQYTLGLAGKLLTHVPDSALLLGTGILSAYMLSAKLPRLKRWILRKFPRQKLEPLLQGLSRLRSVLGGWLLAQVKLSLVSGGILLAGLLILRIPYAPVWAGAICLVDAFPILGTGTVLLPWSLILFLQGDRVRSLGILGIFTIVSISRSVLEPRFVGRQLGLDPLVTLFSLYAGYKFWGFTGMIAAPILAVAAVQVMSADN